MSKYIIITILLALVAQLSTLRCLIKRASLPD